jgi:redox-sensitive bicupin YhaK (pirin superfamily)
VSNLEKEPLELVADCESDGVGSPHVEILTARDVPLGGPRAMNVRRTLPQRKRSTIGGWCFIDHYGPMDVSAGGGMYVPPHPHTGLQTVSWLFAGEIEHRDSVGTEALVAPGEVNLMTAGRGISHSEVSTPATTTLHGVQLWLALPAASRMTTPSFEHAVPPIVTAGGAKLRVFIGELAGSASEVEVFTPLVGAQIDVPRGTSLTLDLDPRFEHGVLVDLGPVTVNGTTVYPSDLAYLETGNRSIRIEALEFDARVLLLGGEPLGEQIVMWWNFIGRSHEEIVQFRSEWQHDVIQRADAAGPFGTVAGFSGSPLPAPELPTVRLKPRG